MESLRPLMKANFTDVIDYGIFLFRKHFKKLFMLNLIFNIPVVVVLTLINPMFSEQYWNFFEYGSEITDPNAMLSTILVMYGMIFGALALQGIFSLTAQNIMEGSMIKLLYADAAFQQQRPIKEVLTESLRQFWQMLFGRVLYGLIVGLVGFVLYIVAIALIFGGTFLVMTIAAVSTISTTVMVILMILGIAVASAAIFFLSLLVCYYFGKYRMFLPVICIEQRNAIDSIGRCNDFGKKSFYLTSLTFAAGSLLAGLFPGIINIAFSVTSIASGNFDTALFQVGAVITQIFTAVLQPLLVCIMTALYITLRVRHEGLDIELNLSKLQQEELDKQQRWMAEATHASK